MQCGSRKISHTLVAAATLLWVTTGPPARAADHGDAPIPSSVQSIDIGDLFQFLDPNDNSQLVLVLTLRGFIVPGEAGNFGFFDDKVVYELEIENTGDARPDETIEIRFRPRSAATSPQTAMITLPASVPFGRRFEAPTTPPTLAPVANEPVVTTDPVSGASFFAGEVDDPFFFDIPGFNRFVASVLAGSPDPTQLDRGRDTFAGYNIMAIALRIPVEMLAGRGPQIGVSAVVSRGGSTRTTSSPFQPSGRRPIGDAAASARGSFPDVDRAGNPAVNVALVPFARKDEYNAATTVSDSRGAFANDIVATLRALGTSQANIDVLAGVAVARGDFLRLDPNVTNSGGQGGTNAGAGFPNGRRLGDDVIDTILQIVSNGAITEGDHVDGNDVAFRDEFPFVAPAQQPRASGTVDDNTRN